MILVFLIFFSLVQFSLLSFPSETNAVRSHGDGAPEALLYVGSQSGISVSGHGKTIPA